MPSAQVWSGVAQGLGQLSKDMSSADLRQAQLAEAKSKQQLSQQQLQEYTANAPQRKQAGDLQMQQLEAQTRTVNQQSLGSMTISAMDRFNADGNVRHLNTWLADAKKNPIGANIYGPVSRYDALTKSDSNDKLLRDSGYTPDDVYGDPDLADDLIVVTQNDGNQVLLPKETLYASTKYTSYLDDKQLGQMERKARVNQMLLSGQSKAKVTMQERVVQDLIDTGKANSVSEAYQLLQEMDSKGRGTGVTTSTEERAVKQIMEDSNVGYVEALGTYYSTKKQGSGSTNESRFAEQYMEDNPGATYQDAVGARRNLGKTTTQKEVGDVKELRLGLDKINWLESSVGDMSKTERAKIYRDYISPLEDLRGFKLSTDDKRTIRDLRSLTALGGTAGTELTPDETGILDSTLNEFKKYVFDEVGGKKGVASYETFRNVFRNALYGASLTKTEIASFNKAAGTLGQKFQPVIAQLKVQMETIKTNLEGIRDLNDPDIAHYYTGQSIDEIDDSIRAIEDRLNDPRLRLDRATKGQEIKVKRVDETAEPIVPDVSGNGQAFDFDAAMSEAGL